MLTVRADEEEGGCISGLVQDLSHFLSDVGARLLLGRKRVPALKDTRDTVLRHSCVCKSQRAQLAESEAQYPAIVRPHAVVAAAARTASGGALGAAVGRVQVQRCAPQHSLQVHIALEGVRVAHVSRMNERAPVWQLEEHLRCAWAVVGVNEGDLRTRRGVAGYDVVTPLGASS